MSENSPTPVELNLVVGSMITVRNDENRAVFRQQYDMATLVQEQLQEAGVAVDVLARPGEEVWVGGIETLDALYHLARLATHLERGDSLASIVQDGAVLTAELDSAVTDVWSGKRKTRFAHLVCLQGINSYYVPVDFDAPLWLPFENEVGEDDEAFFGSSVRLVQELLELGELLEQAGVPSEGPAARCRESLLVAAQQSVAAGLPLIVW